MLVGMMVRKQIIRWTPLVLLLAVLLCPKWGFAQETVLCDGSDDTSAVQAAIDKAGSRGTPIILDGTCAVSQISLHDHTNISGGIMKQISGTTTPMMILSASTDRDWRIHDMELVGNYKAGECKARNDGIYFDFGSDNIIHRGFVNNVYIHNFAGDGFAFHYDHAAGAIHVASIFTYANCGNGIVWDVDDSFCSQCESAQNGGDGIQIIGWDNHIADSKVWENGQNGFNITGEYNMLTAPDAQANRKMGIKKSKPYNIISSAQTDQNGTNIDSAQ
jgi:hypothetical protein